MNLQEQDFVIVDLETTGSGLGGNRITEICMVRLRGEEILDKYTSLVDPQMLIPDFITSLTGIDNEMTSSAPLFEEIAQDILDFTKDAVFVAHNVSFDYNVLRNEFKRLELPFTRKKLCTVRLSRKIIPGFPSYSLGRLCNSLGIDLVNRHRAEGDTDATVELFKLLLTKPNASEVMLKALKPKSREGTFPPHLDRSQFNELPEVPGVYLFKNQAQKVIYVGKAINLKKRVLSHFYNKRSKSYHMCQEIHHIEHIPTGSELVALLQEAELILHYYPKYNAAQKKPRRSYQILHYKNQKGVIQFAVGVMKSYDSRLVTHYSRAHAVEQLEQLCEEYNLCPRYCSFNTKEHCTSHYKIKSCKGVCREEELVQLYNIRANQAIRALQETNATYFIQEQGRTEDEFCLVMVKDGEYVGFGFVPNHESIESVEQAESYIESKKPNYHTSQILRAYIEKSPGKRLEINNWSTAV